MRDHLELSKPRITLLVALTAAAGFTLAAGHGVDWTKLFWTAIGVALAAASTGCLNQALEADFDALMDRTKRRPLPSGRVRRGVAFVLGLAWGAVGLGLLAWKVNAASFGLTAFTLVSYLLVYTPMKRFSPWSLWVGAVPGALPPVIGWVAGAGPLDGRAAALFLLQFFWQLPHFLALAWIYREDYAKGGYRVWAVNDPSGVETAWQMGATSCALVLASLVPYAVGLAGPGYLVGAMALGGMVLIAGLKSIWDLGGRNARQVFLASLVYLPSIYALLLVHLLKGI